MDKKFMMIISDIFSSVVFFVLIFIGIILGGWVIITGFLLLPIIARIIAIVILTAAIAISIWFVYRRYKEGYYDLFGH